MRAFILCALLAVFIVLTGCVSPHAAFVRAIDTQAGIILPRYQAYTEADKTIDPTTRRIRLEAAAQMNSTIRTAREGLGDNDK